MRTLYAGLTGDDVALWQAFLRGLRPNSQVITNGIFDPTTKLETQSFQRSNGLDPDGVVGRMTMGKAMALGFDPLADDRSSESGPNWPPRPATGPLTVTDRARLFGAFAYKAAPVPSNPEAIVITDGWDKANIVNVQVSQLALVKGSPANHSVQFNHLVTKQLQALWDSWEEAGLIGHVITWGGSWAPRFIRGSRTTLSNHAWGTAFDINVSWNMLGAQPALKGEQGSVRELVELAHQHGFYWGGWFLGRPDGMHFECFEVQS